MDVKAAKEAGVEALTVAMERARDATRQMKWARQPDSIRSRC